MDLLAKRLIAANSLGIWIEYADGHRWIRCEEAYGSFNYHKELKDNGILVNNKIYGGLEEALDVIDITMEMMSKSSLKERYDNIIDEEWDVYYSSRGLADSRIDYTDGGKGGLY